MLLSTRPREVASHIKCVGLFLGGVGEGDRGEVRVTFLFLLFSRNPSVYGIQYAKMSYFGAICPDHHQYICICVYPS